MEDDWEPSCECGSGCSRWVCQVGVSIKKIKNLKKSTFIKITLYITFLIGVYEMPVRVCVIGGGRWVCNFSKFSKIKKITKSDIVCQMSLLVAVSIFKVLKNPKILKITKMCCMAAARSSFLLIHHVTIH